MKRTYVKPLFIKREKLSAVTAQVNNSNPT